MKLPVVEVSVWYGISDEDKKKLVEGITNVIAELHTPREAITISFTKSQRATGLLADNYIQKDSRTAKHAPQRLFAETTCLLT